MVGDLISSVVMQNVPKMTEYRLWWDGRTTDNDVQWNANDNQFVMKGNKMCRNGRYFVVLTIIDAKGKEKNYKKQAVLIK
jgi:hypothetical protein